MRRALAAVLVLTGCGAVVEPPRCVAWEHPTPYVSVCVATR